MKKLLFILVAIFAVLVFKPTTDVESVSAQSVVVEGSILNTTQQQMEIFDCTHLLMPPTINALTLVSPVNVAGKNTVNNLYKHLQSKYQDEVRNVIRHNKEIISQSYKIISQAVNYYIFYLRRIRV